MSSQNGLLELGYPKSNLLLSLHTLTSPNVCPTRLCPPQRNIHLQTSDSPAWQIPLGKNKRSTQNERNKKGTGGTPKKTTKKETEKEKKSKHSAPLQAPPQNHATSTCPEQLTELKQTEKKEKESRGKKKRKRKEPKKQPTTWSGWWADEGR